MPTYPHIETYYKELEDIIHFGGSDNESSIRAAFQNCLSQYCSDHRENLKLTAGLAGPRGNILFEDSETAVLFQNVQEAM